MRPFQLALKYYKDLHKMESSDQWPFAWTMSLKQLGRSCPVYPASPSFETFLISWLHYVFSLHCNSIHAESWLDLRNETLPTSVMNEMICHPPSVCTKSDVTLLCRVSYFLYSYAVLYTDDNIMHSSMSISCT